ncbi:DUF3566 domain-containing protein [Micromonospora sp. WMMD1128]|uniref:DUF3566 domain-containing protein n=1 Tax=unclassified Micromonospora TaxID=2617518 RepID=UPI00248CCE3A|nr:MULTISPECIES: DUF3566 domain-containing protein [unclassified Micromonospora]WBB73679.1 DUF3566 domain-containing protein [Micromonospora sp. WMMD1128]WFE32916.1 DUF3566 domain-containing protein [Micromonospora sp. WMMD975]
MTETQAKSGNKGTSATPVEEEAAQGGTPATGRAAVGRATVPADAPAPKFTRAPGMAPPPDKPGDDSGSRESTETKVDAPTSADGFAAPAAAKPATSTPPTKATAAARPSTGTTGMQPRIGAGLGTAPKATPEAAGPSGANPGRPANGGGLPPGISGAAAVGAARVGEAVRAARTSVGSAASRGPRRARLNLKRIDPWSVMKFAFAVSVVLFIVVVVATSVLYLALDAMGVFKSVNDSLTDLVNAGGGSGGGGFRVTAKGVIMTSALVGLVNVVLFTALATLSAFVYNVCADLVGGIELTLAERD